MRRLSCLVFSLALFGLVHGPASGQATKEAPPGPQKKEVFKAPPARPMPGPSFKHLDGQMLVYVVNGAGGSSNASDNLIDLNGELQLRLRIQMVPWCRHNAIFQDLVDTEAQLNAATKIACSITAIRRDAPNAHIFIVGHSAGGRVALAAAEMLPAKSLDRVILLSPAVSRTYDLTTALKTTKYGIDHFYSSEDGVLDTGNAHYRNADGAPGLAAGKHGFVSAFSDKATRDLYCNLRQYRWNEDLCGNGGHCVWIIRHNLKKAVVPVFFTVPVTFAAPPPFTAPPPAVDKKKMSAAD